VKLNARIIVLCAAVVLLTSAAFAQNPRPLARAAEEYEELLFTRSYRNLEAAATEAHLPSSLTGDGQPRLAAIYGGTVGCGCGDSQSDDRWNLRGERLREWRKNYPNSVTAKVAVASWPVELGWRARGGGYANTVKPEAWKEFYKYLDEARDALNGLDEDAKNDPGWFVSMLRIANARQWPPEQYEALYEKAQRKHPDYLPIYFVAANHYSPKWSGSIEELQRFIDRATEATRPKLGETLYARLVWSEWRSFGSTPTDWPRMKAGFERMVKDYPDPWNINNYAQFACRNQDWATVVALSERIGSRPVIRAWFDDVRYFEGCVNTAKARATPSQR